jgi:hypothetical protein
MSSRTIDAEHAKDVCLLGQGHECCRYLTMGSGGFQCAKKTSLRMTLDARGDTMVARGDNCSGLPAGPMLHVLTDAEQAEWDEWLAGRPPHVREVCEKLPPWNLYRNGVGQRVTIVSYDSVLDDDTDEPTGEVQLSIEVGDYWNFVVIPRKVFGVPPDDLVPCSDHRPWQEVPDDPRSD